jgi:hypothetical protein
VQFSVELQKLAICEEVQIPYSSCQVILAKALGMRCASATFVPQLLTQELA